jgi:hypothetical protein
MSDEEEDGLRKAKTTTRMKRSKIVKVGCTSTSIQLWRYTSLSTSYSKMSRKKFIEYLASKWVLNGNSLLLLLYSLLVVYEIRN